MKEPTLQYKVPFWKVRELVRAYKDRIRPYPAKNDQEK